MNLPHGRIATGLLITLIGLSTMVGCAPSAGDSKIYTPAPQIDWLKCYELAKALFDVSMTTTITDEQLSGMYQTDTDEVLVRSTTFPGDTSPSRYMFVKDSATRKQTVYLSGTNSQTLWGFDLDLTYAREPDFHALVHRGFDNAALTVLDDVLPRLDTGYTTVIAGYSLGGAMAVLLAEHLIINGYAVKDVVTFGQPKVTDQNGLATLANVPLLRFVNRNDPVPHLPPDDFTPPENYDHFAPEVILYDGPYYAYLVPGDPSYVPSTTGNLLNTLLHMDLNQHGNIYVSRMAAKLNDQGIQIPYVAVAPAP